MKISEKLKTNYLLKKKDYTDNFKKGILFVGKSRVSYAAFFRYNTNTIMYKFLVIFIFTLVAPTAWSQEKSLTDYEKELNELSIEIISNANDEAKQISNQKFKTLLKEVLTKKESFDYPFKNIRAISILSSNNKVKIYNWALPYSDQTYEYFAFVQLKLDKDVYKVTELIDKSAEIENPESKSLTDKNWFGALYYEIIYNKKLDEHTYTLLGWDGDYNLTNKKVIDAMTIDANGKIKFASPLFKNGKKSKKRVIFTYSETAVMSLKYHEKESRIVFDYLVPTSSNLEGIFEYYGPSLNRFDAYQLDKKNWQYQTDVDVHLDKNLKDRFYNSPK